MDDWMGVYRMGILIRGFEGLFLLASLRAGFVHVHVVPTKAGGRGIKENPIEGVGEDHPLRSTCESGRSMGTIRA